MDLKQHLLDGDPVARERGLDDAEVRAMRQTMLVESRRDAAPQVSLWPRPIVVAVIVAACLVLGVGVGVRLSDELSPVPPRRVVTPAPDIRRQLQITSPGGTRIIWTFHQEFDL